MLNELWSVSRALERHAILVRGTSKRFAKNMNADGLLVRLDQSGEISSVELLDCEQVSLLGRYEYANGMGFPTFNILPLRRMPKKCKSELFFKTARKNGQPARTIHLLIVRRLRRRRDLKDQDLSGLQKKLCVIPPEVALVWGNESVPDEFSAVRDLIEALQKKQWRAQDFLRELDSRIRDLAKCLADDGMVQKLEKLCRRCFFKEKFPLLLDFDVRDGKRYSVTSPEMRDFLNDSLLAVESGQKSEDSAVDALSGKSGELENRFPAPTVRVLKKAILYSNPREVKCQGRYGLQEGRSFSTTKSTARTLRNAIDFIAHDSRRGKTWQSIPKESGKGANLVVAYVEEEPNVDGPFADFFAGDGERAAEGVFEKQANQVLQILTTFQQKYGSSTVRMFVLGKPDPGRCQVIVSEVLTYERLRESADRWSESCRNIPRISIVIPLGRNRRGKQCQPAVPKPLSCLRVLNTQYVKNGKRTLSVRTASLRDVYGLFLCEHHPDKEIARLLRTLTKQIVPLALNLGRARQTGKRQEINVKDRFAACDAMSTLGMLLYYSHRKAENYMREVAYGIGQLLQAANQLHKEYCYIVRNAREERKGYPAQFIGEAFFKAALTDPARALEQLSKRILPYYAWAQKVTKTDRDDYIRAKGALNRLQEVSRRIPREQLERRFDDVDRAELLLGYLSDLQQNPSSEGETV